MERTVQAIALFESLRAPPPGGPLREDDWRRGPGWWDCLGPAPMLSRTARPPKAVLRDGTAIRRGMNIHPGDWGPTGSPAAQPRPPSEPTRTRGGVLLPWTRCGQPERRTWERHTCPPAAPRLVRSSGRGPTLGSAKELTLARDHHGAGLSLEDNPRKSPHCWYGSRPESGPASNRAGRARKR